MKILMGCLRHWKIIVKDGIDMIVFRAMSVEKLSMFQAITLLLGNQNSNGLERRIL